MVEGVTQLKDFYTRVFINSLTVPAGTQYSKLIESLFDNSLEVNSTNGPIT